MDAPATVRDYLATKRKTWGPMTASGPGPNTGQPSLRNYVLTHRFEVSQEIRQDVSRGWAELCKSVNELSHHNLIEIAADVLALALSEDGAALAIVVEALQQACRATSS